MTKARVTIDDGWAHIFDIYVTAQNSIEHISPTALKVDEAIITFSDGSMIEKVEISS